MTAGYSGRSLVAKLGIKSDSKMALINPPDGYLDLLGELPSGVKLMEIADGYLDFIHFFAYSQRELELGFPGSKQALFPAGMLWVSWPKKTFHLETDLNEDIVRVTGLANGLVDIKVCAIDQDWSGLKFVYRKKDRVLRDPS